MNRVIHRHQIPLNDADRSIDLCGTSKIIHVGMKHGEVCIWVEQAERPLEPSPRHFRVFGTGHPIPEGYHHKGSVVDGGFVWHVYERSQYPRD